jgi:hypothetical protein
LHKHQDRGNTLKNITVRFCGTACVTISNHEYELLMQGDYDEYINVVADIDMRLQAGAATDYSIRTKMLYIDGEEIVH